MNTTTITTKTGQVEAVRTGTIKVGRWTYPAIERTDGAVVRNEKTDGSQNFAIAVDPAKVVWTETPGTITEHEGLPQVGLSPLDKAMLAQIGNTAHHHDDTRESFDFFDDGIVAGSGIWFAHAAEQTSNPPAARRAFRSLANKGMLDIADSVNQGDDDRWMELTAQGAAFALAYAGQPTDLPEFKAGHATGGGNQTKRPGKSTWKLGEPCPQGHTLTAENLYVMPSGRKQCQDCRKGMPSRVAK